MRDGREELAPATMGALIGAAAAALIAPLIRPWFSVPTGGIGYVTIHQYPKGWDYAVVALIVIGSFAGGAIASRRVHFTARSAGNPRWIPIAIAMFLLVVAIRYNPAEPLDQFHEGEELTPAFQLRSGQRPYSEVFFNHGLAADGGLHALILRDAVSIVNIRFVDTILNAATLALLAAIAAEVCATTGGVALAAFAALCASGLGIALSFPVFRLAPVFIAALALLRYLRTQLTRWVALAMCVSTLGLLWSLDTGMFATIGTAVLIAAIHAGGLGRASFKTLMALASVALVLPIVMLLIAGGDVHRFFIDSFVIVPRAIDAIGSLPAPDGPRLRGLLLWIADEPARYYLPLVSYGFFLAIALQRWRSSDRVGAAKLAVLTTFALLMFRSAAGRADANHIRFALPLLGVLIVASVIEPLAKRSRVVGTIAVSALFILILNVVPSVVGSVEALLSWKTRQGAADTPTRDIVADLNDMRQYLGSFGADATFLNFSNGLGLYYLLERKPPIRVPDIKMLAAPPFGAEAMAQLRANPPAFVILEAPGAPSDFDGIYNGTRVPELDQWIKANYPRRLRVGRFLVAER